MVERMDTDKAKTMVTQTLATFFHRADLAGLHITEQAALLRCTTSTCYRLRKEARPEILASTYLLAVHASDALKQALDDGDLPAEDRDAARRYVHTRML